MSAVSMPDADVEATIPLPIPLLRASQASGAAVPGVLMSHPVPGGQVCIRGRLDVHTVAEVRLLLQHAVDSGSGDLLVDLADAEIGDATGLGVLVGAHHRARRAGRQLVLVDVSDRLERLLRAARLHLVLACRSSTPADLLEPTSPAP